MSIYKVSLLTPSKSGRYPDLQELKEALDKYKIQGQGIVVQHSSLFDYRYDTESSDYHKVESAGTIGIMKDSLIEDEKIYLIIDFNNSFDENKKYILFYRATVQTNPGTSDHNLHFSNLFAIDLITVLDKEQDDMLSTNLSSVVPYDDEWNERFGEETSSVEEIENENE